MDITLTIKRESENVWIVEGKRCESLDMARVAIIAHNDANGHDMDLSCMGEIDDELTAMKIGDEVTQPIPQDDAEE